MCSKRWVGNLEYREGPVRSCSAWRVGVKLREWGVNELSLKSTSCFCPGSLDVELDEVLDPLILIPKQWGEWDSIIWLVGSISTPRYPYLTPRQGTVPGCSSTSAGSSETISWGQHTSAKNGRGSHPSSAHSLHQCSQLLALTNRSTRSP